MLEIGFGVENWPLLLKFLDNSLDVHVRAITLCLKLLNDLLDWHGRDCSKQIESAGLFSPRPPTIHLGRLPGRFREAPCVGCRRRGRELLLLLRWTARL